MTPAEPAHNTFDKIGADGRINVVSPLDGRIIDRIAASKAADLPDQIAKARTAQQTWAQTPLKQRAQILAGSARALADAAEEIVEILREEIGRHPAESWFAEVVPNIDLVNWWCKHGYKHLATQNIPLNPINFPGKKAQVALLPRGVLGLITPWNYPVSIPLRALVPALLAGNAVIWKPSEYAAKISQRLYEALSQLVPANLLILCQGDGRIGAAIVDQVDGIGFTGSLNTGKLIARRAAERLIPASLELGGKDFAVVLADANLERAAAGIAWAALTNAGQNCAAVEIVAVQEEVAARFIELLREEVRRMAPFVGPLVNHAQKNKVAQQLDEAVAQGALVLEGGLAAPDGLRIEPTLLERAPWHCSLIRDETFGPIVPVITFKKLKEIDAQLDASQYGLTLSVWSNNIAKAKAWLWGKPVGVCTINNHGFTAGIAAMPWTGVKGSGLGVTNSLHALEWMVRPQGLLVDRSRAREPWWHPFNQAAITLARSITDLNSKRRSLLQALPDLIKGFLTRWK